jgi:hypothetical protein
MTNLTAPFVLFITFLGIGATSITGNPWYAIGGFFVIAAWVLAHSWGKYK